MGAIRLLVAARVHARLAYRADLLAGFGSGLLLALVGPIFLVTLFAHIPTLGGWTGPEVLFCWGFADAASGLFYVLFTGLYHLNQRYVLGGDLDRLLLRPADPYLALLAEHLAIDDLGSLVLGGAVMAAAVAWGLPPRPAWVWALLPLLLISAAAVMGGLLTAVASLAFHLRHRGTAVSLALQLSPFARYPLDLFARPIQGLLTWVFPLAFAGFYPATLFMDRPAWHGFALAQPLVAVACLAAGYAAWRVGLARYQSRGS